MAAGHMLGVPDMEGANGHQSCGWNLAGLGKAIVVPNNEIACEIPKAWLRFGGSEKLINCPIQKLASEIQFSKLRFGTTGYYDRWTKHVNYNGITRVLKKR